MAFAAAISGGVAIQQEDLQRDTTASEAVKNIEGNLRLFGRLGAGAGRQSKDSNEIGTESRLVRQHTEASIFISLHDELRRTGRLKALEMDSLGTGDIVSAELGPAVAPLRRVIDQVVRLLELAAPLLDLETDKPAQPDRPAGDMTRQQRRELEKKLGKEALAKAGEDSAGLRQLYTFFLAIQDDLDQSGMVDVVVLREEEPSVILTLDKRFATDQVVELLHTSAFTVVGKVTQLWPTEDDIVNLYRRSVMALLPALTEMSMWGTLGLLASVARAIEANDVRAAAFAAAGVSEGADESDADVDTERPAEDEESGSVNDDAGEEGEGEVLFGDITALTPAVSGPAVQILPLAICT